MIESLTKIRTKKPRIELTDRIRMRFLNNILSQPVPELAKQTRLPYTLLYNIVKRRVKTVSGRNYQVIFGEEPPHQTQQKVDGGFFTKMVDLWLFLNDDISKTDLYREFEPKKHTQKVDYRIFNGQIKTVDRRLEKIMEKKFSDCGVDKQTVKQWIEESNLPKHKIRIPYDQIRPVLVFLKKTLNIHPTFVLNQSFNRYESGELKSVSQKVYARALVLEKSAKKALTSGDRFEIEKVREDTYGKRDGFTLYVRIEEELRFLKKYAKISPKRYLGRSINTYERGKCKRIATWRAEKIKDNCEAIIAQRQDLPFLSLPQSYHKRWMMRLSIVLRSHLANRLLQPGELIFEREILTPSHYRDEYKKSKHTLIQFDMAPSVLGMRRKAFDIMVAKNCDIFRSVGIYTNRWYLPDLYLKELTENDFFELISAKYELMAQNVSRSKPIEACMN